MRMAAPLNLKIYADIMCAIDDELASNSGRIIRLFVDWTRFTYFYAVFNYIMQPSGSSQWRHIQQICGHNAEEFRDHGLNHSNEIA